jgi:hypothetical protein
MLNAMMDVRISPRYPTALRSPLCAANSLYAVARKRARQGQFWSSLTRRSRGLLALKQVSEACTVQAQSDGGVRTVPIGQIRGSEDRSRDFDRDFNPLQDHCKGRWLNIAVARQQGEALPLVALIQVGEIYFVKDGHHRISVARALGQLDIEAKVNVWQVSALGDADAGTPSSDHGSGTRDRAHLPEAAARGQPTLGAHRAGRSGSWAPSG